MTDARRYRVELRGCDDCTYIDMVLSPEALAVVVELSRRSAEESTYTCQPTLLVTERGDD